MASTVGYLLLIAGFALSCSEPASPRTGMGEEFQSQYGLERTSAHSAYIALRQREAANDARYTVSPTSNAAGNPAQRFEVGFRERIVNVTSLDEHWQLDLAFEAITCGELRELPVSSAEAGTTNGNRVDYRRTAGGASVNEWYENGPMGLEQGFTLSESPCPAGETAVTLLVAVDGLRTQPTVGKGVFGSELIELVDENDTPRLRYGDLYATDAAGQVLPARIGVSPRGDLAIRVDTTWAAWPIVVDPLIWGQERKLLPADGQAGDAFGIAVALSADTALVGASYDDVVGKGSQGSAYVFVRSGGTWSQQAQLTTSDGQANDLFGGSVALSGDTAAICARWDDVGADADQGSAYVFTRSGTTWSQQTQLTAWDAPINQFCNSVALFGDTALVGAFYEQLGPLGSAGAAYVFVRSGTSWSQESKLSALDAASGDQFGSSVALSADTALIGNWFDDGASVDQGSAYVFVRNGTVWSQQSRLTAFNGAAADQLGSSVALSEDTALVGTYVYDVSSNADQGSAYVFVRNGTVWSQQSQLTASDGAAGDHFGFSVALSADTALIGAEQGDVSSNTDQGSAYIFIRSGTAWSEQQKLTASDGSSNDRFGSAVALSSSIVLIGARSDSIGASANQGSAYTVALGASNGDGCSSDTDCASDHCVDDVCCNVDCTGACAACSAIAGADFNGVCKVFAAGFVGSPSCAPQTCNGSSLDCTDCAHDFECPNGQYCGANGSCLDQKSVGDVCNLDMGADCQEAGCAACSTGHCADGICCDSNCTGRCESCLNSLTGAVTGTCASIPADQDPENDCDPSNGYPDDCQADGACDGQRACRAYAKAGTACGATVCTNGTVSGQVCNGSGQCDQDDVFCAPNLCDGDACGTGCASNEDCDASGYCISGGTCALAKENGSECNEAFECASSYCVDGVCCEDDCVGQCSACAEVGSEGTCVAISGAPRGQREHCAGDLNLCGGECNGLDGSECTYPGSAKSCGGSCIDAMKVDSTCDGQGACVDGEPTSCGNYLCAGDDCATTCSTDSDCATGHSCDVDACVPVTAQCIEEGAKSQPSTGVARDCTPYRCDLMTGACRKSCAFSMECAPGFVCNPTSTHCEEVKQGSKNDAGCGCRSVGGRSNSPSLPLVISAFILHFALRRRREHAFSLGAGGRAKGPGARFHWIPRRPPT